MLICLRKKKIVVAIGEAFNYDVYWSNVSALLHMDGADNSTSFYDEKLNTWTAAGAAKLSTGVKKFGTSSGVFTGAAGTKVTTAAPSQNSALDMSNATSFTVEAWVYPTALPAGSSPTYGTGYIVIMGGGYGGGWEPVGIGFNSAGKFYGSVNSNNTGSGNFSIHSPNSYALNTWYHVAFVKSGSDYALFVDGVKVVSTTNANSPYYLSTFVWSIGQAQNNTYTFTGNIDDVRITKGIARYTAAFTPPTAAFPSVSLSNSEPTWSKTALLIKATGTNNGTNNTFVDSSSNNMTVTRVGNTTQGTYSPFAIPDGYWSNYFDGTGDYLQCPTSTNFTLNSAFAIECWVYQTSSANGTYNALLGQRHTNDANAWFIHLMNSHATKFGPHITFSNAASAVILTVGSTNPAHASPLNTWFHVAVTYDGTTVRVFQNGQMTASSTFNLNVIGNCANPFTIGNFPFTNEKFAGYISNLRIVRGTAVYTTNFVPSTSPLTPITGTKLLTCSTNKIVDVSATNTMTINGDTKVTTETPFNNPNEISTTVGSAYFDGNGDYLSIPSNAVFSFGTGDFTIEAWVHPAAPIGGGVNNDRTIFGNVSTNPCSFFYLDNASNIPGFWDGTNGFMAASGVKPNMWSHVAVSRASGTMRMFINGVQVATAANNTVNHTTNAYLAVGGSASTSRYMNGYISNLRVSKGIARYTTAFTPSIVTADANTSLLMNFNNGQIVDATGRNVIETISGAKVVTTQSVTGSGALAFNGSSDYIVTTGSSNQYSFGSGDFTIEAWFKATSFGVYGTKRGSIIAHGHWPWSLVTYIDSTGKNILQFFCTSDGTNGNMYSGLGQDSAQCSTVGTSISAGVWHHVALTRSGNTMMCFVDGILNTSWTTTLAVYAAPTVPVCVGGTSNGNANTMFTGYIDDVRITKGFARYTSNFSPRMSDLPAKQLTSTSYDPFWNNVVLSMNMDGANNGIVFTDAKNGVVVANGNVKTTTTQKRFGDTSAYFDGSGDYITIDDTNDRFDMGTGNFTVECWVNTINSGNGQTVLIRRVSGVAGGFALYVYSLTVKMYLSSGTSWDVASAIGTGTITANTWNHISIVRKDNVFTLYVNGVASGSVTSTAALTASTLPVALGASSDGTEPYTGYIDDVRITKGVARYTSDFTPPTTAHLQQ